MKMVLRFLRPLAAVLAAAVLPALAQAPAAPTGRLETRLSTTPSRVVQVDRIVAVVNDEVITQNDLAERVNLVVKQIQKQGGQLPSADVLTRQILERMINDVVQLQVAKENGIKVDDATLDRTIERIAAENSMQLPQFRSALESDGIRFPRFREDIRNEILLARL